jgi:hypothetical protein
MCILANLSLLAQVGPREDSGLLWCALFVEYILAPSIQRALESSLANCK